MESLLRRLLPPRDRSRPWLRYVATQRKEKERRFQDERRAMQNRGSGAGLPVLGDGERVGAPRGPSNTRRPFRPAAFLRARKVGEGAYGSVFRVSTEDPRFAGLPRQLDHRVTRGLPPAGRPVALKVTRGDIRELVREAAVHRRLSSSRACWQPRRSWRRLCSAGHVPAFYFAGRARSPGSAALYTTAMALAGGATVYDVMKKGRFTAGAYVAVERAAASLWAQGVAHGDLHSGNVLYDGRTATVLDMGFAVVLPTRMKAALRAAMVRGVVDGVPSLAVVFLRPWTSKYGVRNAQGFLDRVMYTRGYRRFNSDYTSLLSMYDMLSADQKRRVPAERRAAWGYRERRRKLGFF